MNIRRLACIGLTTAAAMLSASRVFCLETADVSTKDYASLQAAIDANPGRTIQVPSGDHSVQATIRITGEGTSLVGSGRILMTDPTKHILEIEHAHNIRIEGLTFSRPEGAMDTTKEGILISDTRDVTLERVRVIDNRTRSGSIRLSEVRDGRILNCEVRNYMTIAIDDRTANVALLGYAFRCIDGTGIVCDRCRGTLIQGNLIIEENLRPTPEIKAQHQLGKFTKKNPTKGSLISQEVWDAEYTNNWHQGSGLIVTGPTYSDMTRILGNQIENAAQGIDIHSDHVIISNNIVNNAFIGMKAMHGSRNVLVTGNQFSRNVLWSIGLMSGAGASPAIPAAGDKPAVAANVDGGSLIANNVISQFGYGDSYWMWKDASRAVFRFDNGQEPTDPPLRDVLVIGNVISNPDADEHPESVDDPKNSPRYHYAVRIESGRDNSPRNLHFSSNLLPAGNQGVSNTSLAP
ncbi:MAG TPA: right-handed parallel beta-helix repeat-containing protein [Schlesneria sp.]